MNGDIPLRGDLVQYLKSVAEERCGSAWAAWWDQHAEELHASLPTGCYLRLLRKGSGAAAAVLAQLGVDFVDPNPRIEACLVAEGCCPICGGGVSDQERWLHYRLAGGGGGWWYTGWCGPCDIDFLLQRQSGIPAVWRPDAPEVDVLVERLGPEALQRLNDDPPREFPIRESWQDFVERAQAGDEYWTYPLFDSTPESRLSIARVRRGVPIARFPMVP